MDRLMAIYGVTNLNQLAPLIGYEERNLYRWQDKGINFENTVELLALAGWLNLEGEPPAPQPPPDRRLDALADRFERLAERLDGLEQLRNDRERS